MYVDVLGRGKREEERQKGGMKTGVSRCVRAWGEGLLQHGALQRGLGGGRGVRLRDMLAVDWKELLSRAEDKVGDRRGSRA